MTQLVQEGFGSDRKYPEGLRVELLKLGALLIEFMHKELLDHRKELIKFAWNNIKVKTANKTQPTVPLLALPIVVCAVRFSFTAGTCCARGPESGVWWDSGWG